MTHRRTPFSVTVTACFVLAACGDYTSARDAEKKDEPTGVPVDLGSCPALDAERTAVVFDEAGLRAAAPDTPTLAVWLREPAFPPVPKCDGAAEGDRSATCAERDEALDARIAMNRQELSCVLADVLNGQTPLVELGRPVYWESPFHFSDGSPVAVLQAFLAGFTWPLVEQLARHPYVERIEAVPGDVPFLGTLAPRPPDDCPREREDPGPKLVDAATTLQGNGRQRVVIHMNLEGIPEQVPCDGEPDPASCADHCEEFFLGEWDRYIASTRRHVCVLRELDAVIAPGDHSGDHNGSVGSFCTPPLLGADAMVTTEMGRALTWLEAEKIAAHPYVERIVPDPSVFPPVPEGCPLDTTVPVPVPECTDERESAAGKWSEQNEALWSATPGPHEVGLTIRGGAGACPLPTCPPRPNPCPTSEHEYLMEWNQQSQRCVRELIAAVGGTATDEVLIIVNAIWGSLTWEQIQIVAEHPHVERISSAAPEPPP